MRYLHFFILLGLGFIAGQTTRAQYTREIAPFPVVADRGTEAFPFLGGINTPKPQLADFDHDSRVDLFLADPWGKLA